MTNALKFTLCAILALSIPEIAIASVESTLTGIQTKLISTIMPLVAILGLLWAGFSFVSGNANARSHFILALFGAGIGFGAPSIVAFIRGLIQ